MKNLVYVSIIIAAIVVITEFAYIGQTSLAWVIMGLAVAVGLNALAILNIQK